MKRVLAVLALFLLLFPSQIYAQNQTTQQNDLSLTATPAIIDFAIQPSRSYEKSFVLSNSGQQPVPVVLEVESLIKDQIEDKSKLDRFDASEWIELENEALILEADKPQEIVFSVNVPENPSPGGHYAAIKLRVLALENSQTTVVPELSISLLMTVAGNIQESLELVPTDIFPGYGVSGSTHKSSIKVLNSGNVHQIISPELVFTNKNQEIESIKLTPQLILPGVVKTFEEEWTLPQKRMGYYAFLRIEHGDSRQFTLLSDKEFVIIGYSIPWLFSVILASWTGVYLLKRRKNIKHALKVLKQG